jgi:hypothetical protein
VTHSRSIFWLRVTLLYTAIKLVNPELAPLAEMELYTDGISYNPIPPDGVEPSTEPSPDPALVHAAKGGVLIQLLELHRTIFYDRWNEVPGWHIAKTTGVDIPEGKGDAPLDTVLYPSGSADLPWTFRLDESTVVTPLRNTAGVAHSVTFRPDYVSTATGPSATQVRLERYAINAVNAKRAAYDTAPYNNKQERFGPYKNGTVERLSHVYERVHVGGLTYGEQRAWTSAKLRAASRYHSAEKARPSTYYNNDGTEASRDAGCIYVVSVDNPETKPFKLPHGVGTRVVNDGGAANAQKETSDIAAYLAGLDLPKDVPGYDSVAGTDRYRFVTYDFDDDSTATDAAQFEIARESVNTMSGTIAEIEESVTEETARGDSSRRDTLSRATTERHPAAAAKVNRKKGPPKGTARRRGKSCVKVMSEEEVEYWDSFFEPTPSKIGSQVRPLWRPGHIRQS